MSARSSNVAALLTPAGRGAIATIGVRGADAFLLVRRLFLPHGNHALQPTSGIIRVGYWREARGEEVVVSSSRDVWEICCHGGTAAAAAVLQDLAQAGCAIIDWLQWIAQDGGNVLELEARSALAQASTARAALILLDQLDGALERECRDIAELLGLGRDKQEDAIAQAHERLARLNSWASLGQHLATPWQVVIAGPPNVGKSSLVNAIVGYQRSLVFDRPGTTRDAVSVETAIDGWPVRFVDTAGMREAADAIEAAGVERARSHVEDADLVILVEDASQPDLPEAAALRAQHPRALLVANKCDLLPDAQSASQVRHDTTLSTSAVTGAGIDELMQMIGRRLVQETPAAGEAVPFTARHIEAVLAALLALLRGDAVRAIDALRSIVLATA